MLNHLGVKRLRLSDSIILPPLRNYERNMKSEKCRIGNTPNRKLITLHIQIDSFEIFLVGCVYIQDANDFHPPPPLSRLAIKTIGIRSCPIGRWYRDRDLNHVAPPPPPPLRPK